MGKVNDYGIASCPWVINHSYIQQLFSFVFGTMLDLYEELKAPTTQLTERESEYVVV